MKKKIMTAAMLLILAMTAFAYAQNYNSVQDIWLTVTQFGQLSMALNDDSPKNDADVIGKKLEDEKNTLQVNGKSETPENQTTLLTADEQDQTTYNILFNFVRINEYEAVQMEQTGRSGIALRNQIKDQVNLTITEYATLKQVSQEYAVQMAPVHSRAMEIINEHQKDLSADETNTGSPTEVPQELLDLNDQRNTLTLQYRDALRTRLGETVFSRFKQGFDQNFAAQFRPAPDDPSRAARHSLVGNTPGQKFTTEKGEKR